MSLFSLYANIMTQRLIAFLLLSLFIPNTYAQWLPEWELGGAFGAAQVPYYRGAAESRNIVLPLPLAAYRGKKTSIDRQGAHRWLFNSDRVKVNLSLAGGLPVPGDDSITARQGMPGLDPLLEIGPALDIKLWQSSAHALSLHLPLRLAASVDWRSVGYRGGQFSPFFHYRVRGFGRNQWEFNLAMGPQFATKDYHSYYYTVESAYATANRPVYDASAGYSGSRLTLYANKRFGKLWLSLFARYDELRGAVFVDSPLIEKQDYLIGGMVIGWVFKESPRKVYVKHRDRF